MTMVQEPQQIQTNSKDKYLDLVHRTMIDKLTGRLLVIPHLNPDWKIGFVGDPGDCKSITGTKLLIRDFLLHGVRCFSNMMIKVTVRIPDNFADNFPDLIAKYPSLKGIPGGEVVYQTEEFDKYALFRFDERYRKSAIFVDELNLEMAEARRSSSNLNLNTNKVGQELRHLEAALIYTVINEYWVDNRIRDLTDIFVKTQDTALDAENLEMRKRPGETARLMLYAMSRKLTGNTYNKTNEAYGPFYIHVRDMWEAYFTHQIQASQALKYGIDMKPDMGINVEMESTPEHRRVVDEWGWLNKIADDLINRDDHFIPAEDFYYHPEVLKRQMGKRELTEKLGLLVPGLRTETKKINGYRQTVYIVPDEEATSATNADTNI